VIPTAALAIETMVAPVVLITAGGILSGGMLSVAASVNDRMRTMNQERFNMLSKQDGAELKITDLGPAQQERIRQIDTQMPMLVRRHHLLRDAVLSVYVAIGVLVFAVAALGVAVIDDSEVAGIVAVAFALAGSVGLLVSLVIAARSLWLSHDAIDFETEATLRLGTPPTDYDALRRG